MMARVRERRGRNRPAGTCAATTSSSTRSSGDLRDAVAAGQPVCIAATAFALVHLLDAMERDGLRFELPPGSRVMETGGFKGRTRVVQRDELYAEISRRFGISRDAIVAEYGMTELASQYYERGGSHAI